MSISISLVLLACAAAAAASQDNNTAAAAPADTVVGIPKSDLAPTYSGGVGDVVRLAKSGVDESVVVAFIQNSRSKYNPSADEIIRMRDAGLSSKIITAMLQRGSELSAQSAPPPRATVAEYASSPAPASPPPAQPIYVQPVETPPTPTVIYFGGNEPVTYPVYYGLSGLGYTHYYYHYPGCGFYPHVGFSGYFNPRISVGPRFGGAVHFGGGRFGGGAHFGGISRHR